MAKKNNNVLARENRIMINEIKEDIKSIKADLGKLTNHYSKRLPTWASVLFMILTTILGGLIGRTLF